VQDESNQSSSPPEPGEPPVTADRTPAVAGSSALAPKAIDPSTPESVDLLAAALRANVADLATYERVLVTALAAAFPEGMIEVDRERSMGDKLAGRPGKVRALRLHLGETTLELVAGRGTPVGFVARGVRGVTISRKELPLPEWTFQLAAALQRHAAESAEASAALGKLLGA
jgi:hypothetical protein